jgi:hypothetical protein
MNHFCKKITENVLYSVVFEPKTSRNYKIRKEQAFGRILYKACQEKIRFYSAKGIPGEIMFRCDGLRSRRSKNKNALRFSISWVVLDY